MQIVDTPLFVPRRFPQPIDANAIHVWFFPQWPGPVHAVAESALLLALLAGYAQRPASGLCVERGEHGKPHLRDETLEFNLSHSGTAVLLGLSRRQPLGVDLEARQRKRPLLELARRWFSPREVAALEALPESLHRRAFMRLWSCKEAVLKAHGRGIGYGLDRVAFDLDANGRVTGFDGIGGDATSPAWQVLSLDPAQDATAALAWCGPAHRVSAFVADPDHIQVIAAGL